MWVICGHTFNIFIKCLGCNFTLHYFHQSQASDRKIKDNDWDKSIWSQEKVYFVSSTFNSLILHQTFFILEMKAHFVNENTF